MTPAAHAVYTRTGADHSSFQSRRRGEVFVIPDRHFAGSQWHLNILDAGDSIQRK
jgi:hypothetical protein